MGKLLLYDPKSKAKGGEILAFLREKAGVEEPFAWSPRSMIKNLEAFETMPFQISSLCTGLDSKIPGWFALYNIIILFTLFA